MANLIDWDWLREVLTPVLSIAFAIGSIIIIGLTLFAVISLLVLLIKSLVAY